jgi:hypothetical protein
MWINTFFPYISNIYIYIQASQHCSVPASRTKQCRASIPNSVPIRHGDCCDSLQRYPPKCNIYRVIRNYLSRYPWPINGTPPPNNLEYIIYYKPSIISSFVTTNEIEQNLSWEGPTSARNCLRFIGTRRFNTMFTRSHQWLLSWARWIQSTISHPFSLKYILVLSSYLNFFFQFA